MNLEHYFLVQVASINNVTQKAEIFDHLPQPTIRNAFLMETLKCVYGPSRFHRPPSLFLQRYVISGRHYSCAFLNEKRSVK